MKPQSASQTLPALDIVRLGASLLVMVYHLYYWRNGHTPDPSESSNMFWWTGWVGVQVFFTLSGIVIAFSAERADPSRFAISRIVRIAPGVWICATLTMLTLLATGEPGERPALLRHYLASLIVQPATTHIDVVYWSLTVEIAFYALVFMTIYLQDFRLFLKAIVVAGVLSTLYNAALTVLPVLQTHMPALVHHLVKLSNSGYLVNALLLRHGCYFALGVLLWSHHTRYRLPFSIPLMALFALGGSLEVWREAHTHAIRFTDGSFTPTPALLTWWGGLFLLVISSVPSNNMHLERHVSAATLRQAGILTFPIYLLHNNIGLALIQQLNTLGLSGKWPAAIAMLIVIGLAKLIVEHAEPRLAGALKRRLERHLRPRAQIKPA